MFFFYQYSENCHGSQRVKAYWVLLFSETEGEHSSRIYYFIIYAHFQFFRIFLVAFLRNSVAICCCYENTVRCWWRIMLSEFLTFLRCCGLFEKRFKLFIEVMKATCVLWSRGIVGSRISSEQMKLSSVLHDICKEFLNFLRESRTTRRKYENIPSPTSYQQKLAKTLRVNKIAMTSFTKNCRSESTLNCRSRHIWIKLTYTT